MHLHLNPIGGLAGDMFCAALLDLRPELLACAEEALAGLAMPVPVRLELIESEGLLKGRRFRVIPTVTPGEHHHHNSFREIRCLLEAASLSAPVRERALAIFGLLAEAEGKVHGIPSEEVTFHEVGSWDSIADIVSAAALLDALAVNTVSTTPLPLGGGRVQSAHGLLPVPAPATARLLEGLPVIDDGISGERVTPTGAAILKSLQPGHGAPADGVLSDSGMGFGTRSLDGVPNCLQALCIENSEVERCSLSSASATDQSLPDAFVDSMLKAQQLKLATDQVSALCFEIDDQTGEEFALSMDRLRATPGVFSVTAFQGVGKQGRPTMSVELLARPQALCGVAEACFRETSTIGLRWQHSQRFTLSRRQQRVQVGGHELEVKLVQRPSGASAKTEARELTELEGLDLRRQIAAEAARRALAPEPEQDLE